VGSAATSTPKAVSGQLPLEWQDIENGRKVERKKEHE
jgi:hypothetical protein